LDCTAYNHDVTASCLQWVEDYRIGFMWNIDIKLINLYLHENIDIWMHTANQLTLIGNCFLFVNWSVFLFGNSR
jgi:hypothetical protein